MQLRRMFLASVLVVVIGVSQLSAAVPQQISHQGVVVVNGQRWNGTGASCGKFRFAIVDTMGNYRWANDDNIPPIGEPQSDVCVDVVDGVYNVLLGGGGPLGTGGVAIPFEAVSNGDARLRVWFDDGVNGKQQLADDQLFASVPYSFNGVPPGTVVAFAGPTAPPGWLTCDGRVVTKTQYPALFNAITTHWGTGGDASADTFRIPDMRGLFLRGVNTPQDQAPNAPAFTPGTRDPNSSTRGGMWDSTASGNQVGTYQGHVFASHNHGVNDPGHSHGFQMGNRESGLTDRPSNGDIHRYSPRTSHEVTGITIQATGGSETRPINVYVTYIIKY